MDPLLQKATELAKQGSTPYRPIPGRIAYVVSHGQSYASNGYAIRTQGIAKALNEHGLETLCFVRQGRPWDLGVSGESITPEMTINGVRYIHTRWPNNKKPKTNEDKLLAAADALEQLFRIYRPSAVLAGSNFLAGLPAWVAAQRLGVPFHNEVRGFWELSQAAREEGFETTDRFREDAERDTFVAQQADSVFTLNEPMKQELIRRGVSEQNIHIIPNGIEKLPEPKQPSATLQNELGIKPDEKVVAYIGSHTEYEGLELLFDACESLVKAGQPIKLLMVGDKQPLTHPTKKTINSQDVPWLIQTGRIPHEHMADYYALADVVVIPRKNLPVCQIVPPIKVVEALSYRKPLVLSDIAPLKPYTEAFPAVTSFQAGSSTALATAIQTALTQSEQSEGDIESLRFTYSVAPMLEALTDQKLMVSQKKQPSSHPSLPVELNVSSEQALSSDPVWHELSVRPEQTLIIKAAVEYRNTKGARNRKAVLLLKSYDSSGNEVDKPCGRVAKSGHLKAYFKYLPCTQSKVQDFHEFSVPPGVKRIKVGLCGFNKSEAEAVVVKSFAVAPKPDKSQTTQFVPPSKQAAEISILGWPDYPPNGKPYVIGVMDEFTTGCFEQDVNLIQPRPDNWYALAEKYQPELFFIESAWKGNFGSWQYRVAEYANKPGHEVAHMCQYAKEKGIPTLFWNKEDPVHHEKFMGSAKLTDHIFTTDANMKVSYQAKTGNQDVHALPFAAQPALHKPAPLAGRKPLSCFAGSWYGNRHAERGQAMGWLLQAANKYGLEIYDRNHGTGIFPFPEEYQKGIKGSLPYKALCDEYSRYRIFLNVNSVTESPTMFSRRVFELMACGTPIVSTYAKGIDNLFESGAVWMVHSQEEADEAIHTLMTDDAEWRRRSLAGIREVFAKHTYAHRLNDIFERLGIESRMPTDPAILLVAEANSQADLVALNHFAKKQRYCPFRVGVECTTGIANSAAQLSDKIVLLQPGGKTAWVAAQQADYPVAGWLSPRSSYGDHYLRDLANASLYEPDAEGWAKSPEQDTFAYGQQAMLCGAIWRMAEFQQHHILTKPDNNLSRPALYLADNDQFHHGGLVQQKVTGG